MFKFIKSWRKPEEMSEPTNSEKVSKFLLQSNEIFKIFINNCSWLYYLIAGLLIFCCMCYYISDYKRRLDFRRRRENVQRVHDRLPQRRRPGAVYRDHQIFRNAVQTVRQYIGFNRSLDTRNKPLVLKRTRSGVIYGSFSDS